MTPLLLLKELLFPQGSLGFIFLIMAFFLFAFLLLSYKIYLFHYKIQSFIKEGFSTMEGVRPFGDPYQEYQKSFLDMGENMMTKEDARVFFNEERILYPFFYFRFFTAVPSLLVGLGVLGTFTLLSFGFLEFAGTSEPILSNVGGLFSMIVTSFSSSIWGLSLSILFNLTGKGLFFLPHRHLALFNKELNKEYRASSSEMMRRTEERQLKLLKELFVPLFLGVSLLGGRGEGDKGEAFPLEREGLLHFENLKSLGQIIGETIYDPLQKHLFNFQGGLTLEDLFLELQRVNASLQELLLLLDRSSGVLQEHLQEVSASVVGGLSDTKQISGDLLELMVSFLEELKEDQRKGQQIKDSLRQYEDFFGNLEDTMALLKRSAQDLKEVSETLLKGSHGLQEELGP